MTPSSKKSKVKRVIRWARRKKGNTICGTLNYGGGWTFCADEDGALEVFYVHPGETNGDAIQPIGINLKNQRAAVSLANRIAQLLPEPKR